MEKKFFDSYYFEGSYREIGRQYGEELKDQLQDVYNKNLEKLITKDKIPYEKIKVMIEEYYSMCSKLFPNMVEQLKGEGESSGIGDFGAMLINVSREIGAICADRLMECTAYAVSGEYTKNGKSYSGQNQDMTTGYDNICSIVTFAVPGKPKVMFMLPAGNLAFSGMNSEGISCNRNFLFGSPWKFVPPRYFVTRVALESRTLNGVIETMEKYDYPSSHHSLYADRLGNILSYELDSNGFAYKLTKNCFVHTNHFLLPEMEKYERRSIEQRKNSICRLETMKTKLEENKGNVDEGVLKNILTSHENGIDSICVHNHNGSSTIASMINCLDEGKMLVSKGNPCINGYKEYKF